MSKLHRNSQKRIYVQNCVYWVTTCTFDRYPYFLEDIFCELLVEEIKLCQQIKGFELLGYKINPEHVHLMFVPNEKYNVSMVMHFLKRHFSRNMNYVFGYNKNDVQTIKATLANVAFIKSEVEKFNMKIKILKERYEIKKNHFQTI
jgi:REP element-mobilizing transposase RayT